MALLMPGIVELDEQCILPDVGRNAPDLECLESHPVEEFVMDRGKFSKILGHILVAERSERLLLCSIPLSCRVLANASM
jgi:hypothetical protein